MYLGPRRKLNRLKGYDYSSPGFYFVTICIKNRQEILGEVRHGIMGLNEMGCVAHNFWQNIPQYYDNVEIDQFIIMPNHVHGIIAIKEAGTGIFKFAAVRTEHCSVRTSAKTHPVSAQDGQFNKYGLLSKIIKSYKEMVLKHINNQTGNHEFKWQRSFYDHIIRDEKSLENIRKYIINNPLKWDLDHNNSEDLLM